MENSENLIPGQFVTKGNRPPAQLPPLILAYIGDTVYDLFVRRHLVETTDASPHALHMAAAKKVCAAGQAEAFRLVESMLTPEETGVYKRGRNAHSGTVPKNASVADYHMATGFEALVGYLYLMNAYDRLTTIMGIALGTMEQEQ